MIAAALLSHRQALGFKVYPPLGGVLNSDILPGLVYASDMVKHYGDACPISDSNPTGSRVSSDGLVLSWDGHSQRNGKCKNFADPSGNTDGVASGGVAIGGAQGVRGPATSFDGVDDGIVLPSGILAGKTVAFRVKFTPLSFPSTGGAGNIFYNGGPGYDSSGFRYVLESLGGNRLIMSDGGTSVALVGPTLTAGQTYDVCGVITPTMAYLFVDGSMYAQASLASGVTPSINVRLMRSTAGYPANAILMEALAWVTSKSNTEVRQLFEDSQGWVSNIANPHCKDIDTAHPLGSDRDVLLGGANTPISDSNPTGSRVSKAGLVLSFDGHSLRNHAGGADGVASGGVVLGGVAGPRGPATAFDGVDDRLIFPGLPDLSVTSNQLSISAQFKMPSGHSATQALFALGYMSQSADIWLYYDANSLLQYQYRNKSDGLATTITLGNISAFEGQVIGLVFEVDYAANTYAAYINGAQLASGTHANIPKRYGGSNYWLNTGVAASGSYPSSMTSCETRVFTRLLSQTEIRELHEDFWGHWASRDSNPHCLDISDEHPLGTDRVSDDGLVLSLDMETLTADGRLKDFSGLGNHGLIGGTPKYAIGTVKNGSYVFASATDCINTGVITDYDKLTLAIWYKPSNFAAVYNLFGKGNGDRIIVDVSGKVQLGCGTNAWGSAGQLTIGKASLIIAKFDGANLSVKVDNVSGGAGSLARAQIANPFKIGYWGGTAMQGSVGQALILNRITTDDEDATLYTDSQKASGLGQGLVLSLDMESLNADGTMRDMSGQGNHATISGAKYQRSGIKNGAYSFAGGTDKLTIGTPASFIVTKGQPFTVSAFVNKTATAAQAVISKYGFNGGVYFGFVQSINDYFSLYLKGADGTALWNQSVASVPSGRVCHIAAVYDGTNITLYLNGAATPANVQASNLATVDNEYVPMIGNSSGGQPFTGQISQPFWLNRALSADEISKLYIDGQKMLGLCVGNPGQAPAPVGSAVDLNGTSQYVEVQDCPALDQTNLSMGCWLNSDVPAGAAIQQLIGRYGGAGVGCATYFMWLSVAGKAVFGAYNAATASISASNPVSANKWTLAVGTINGTNYNLFVDGVNVANRADGVVPQASVYPLRIGSLANVANQLFDGRIAYPFIANQAYSQDLINRIRRMQLQARW